MTTGTDSEDALLGEVSQTEKNRYHVHHGVRDLKRSDSWEQGEWRLGTAGGVGAWQACCPAARRALAEPGDTRNTLSSRGKKPGPSVASPEPHGNAPPGFPADLIVLPTTRSVSPSENPSD